MSSSNKDVSILDHETGQRIPLRSTLMLTRALMELHGLHTKCTNCENFKHDTEKCALANQRPPAKVIANGCSAWEHEIPF